MESKEILIDLMEMLNAQSFDYGYDDIGYESEFSRAIEIGYGLAIEDVIKFVEKKLYNYKK